MTLLGTLLSGDSTSRIAPRPPGARNETSEREASHKSWGRGVWGLGGLHDRLEAGWCHGRGKADTAMIQPWIMPG